jgi:hypothetical protein
MACGLVNKDQFRKWQGKKKGVEGLGNEIVKWTALVFKNPLKWPNYGYIFSKSVNVLHMVFAGDDGDIPSLMD